VYFGGGTPSLLQAAQVGRVLETAAAAFPIGPDAEISLESNPDGATEERLRALRAAGVNRLTLGWQSLRADGLRALTRAHSAPENVEALAAARAAGFENVAVDLIFGWPGQTPATWRAELSEAARLGPEHVSAYELTFEEGTRLARRRREGRYAAADEDTRADMFQAAGEILGRHGIERYEISNFARPGRECLHNLASWRGDDLLGVGASAASHVMNARWANVADLEAYVRRIDAGGDASEGAEVLGEETWAAEDLYLGLRTSEGVDAEGRLARLPPPARAALTSALDRAEAEGLLARSGGRRRLTRRGLLLADTVFEALLSV
jgi:oxygen-independent coproporphyrinogen-3 oxidase